MRSMKKNVLSLLNGSRQLLSFLSLSIILSACGGGGGGGGGGSASSNSGDASNAIQAQITTNSSATVSAVVVSGNQ